MPITCGIDWAEAHHDVALVDEGRVMARCRIAADVAGFTALQELIAENGGSPADTPVAIETDKNLFVVALAGAVTPSTRSTHGQWRVIANGMAKPVGSPIPVTPSSWPTFCARTYMCIDRCRTSPNKPWRSRLWRASIKRRSGR